ncbi:hypothetical protein QUG92_06410 [Curtobacterium sp. RHCKG23]|uniref:Uncharacterized protein n=1 Tax=Curtobacterium citri TaxID=3055139 RepID=A0ABT7T580_9MICO|nr:hypothetical protein [Curtobacterium citri]MDM7884735.1 hypothetical protein [Curtobacterium citri]
MKVVASVWSIQMLADLIGLTIVVPRDPRWLRQDAPLNRMEPGELALLRSLTRPD